MTRLDLAASMNKTGGSGDWIVEYSVGEVTNSLPTLCYPMDLAFSPFTPTTYKIALVKAPLASRPSGLMISENNLVTNATGSASILYNDSLRPLGIDHGILLPTGGTPQITNTSGGFRVQNHLPGDSDFEAAAGKATLHAAILEFDLTTKNTIINQLASTYCLGQRYKEFACNSVDYSVTTASGNNCAFLNENSPLTVITDKFDNGYFRNNDFLDEPSTLLPIIFDSISEPLTIVLPINSGKVNPSSSKVPYV